MKKCNKCNKEKNFSNFYKKKISNDGYNNICIECRKEYNINNKEKTKEYYIENKKQYQKNNKKYYENNKEKIIQNSLDYQKYNPKLAKQYYNKWSSNNKAYFKNWRKNKWDNNPNFKLRILLGNRLNECLKKSKTYKNSNIIKLLGCSLDEFKLFLENQFLPEMTWKNHGIVWEVDHIKSLFNFDLTKLEEQQKAFYYTNHQPLFKTTEIAKSFGYTNHIGNRNKSSK